MTKEIQNRILKVAETLLKRQASSPLLKITMAVKPIMKKIKDGNNISQAESKFLLEFYWDIYKHLTEEV